LLLVVANLAPSAHSEPKAEPHRSPIDLALLPGGKRALTANYPSDTLSLIDLDAGKVLHEAACGKKPSAVACSADGRRAAVSNLWSGSVSLFTLDKDELKPAGEITVGPLPRGLVFARDNRTLYVAVAGSDEVIECGTTDRKVTHRWPAPREPRGLALSADGDLLAAASNRSAQVRVWNTKTHKLHWERNLGTALNLRGLAFAPDGKSLLCAHVVRREFPVSRGNIEEGWVTDSRLSRLPLNPDAKPPREQIALDTKGAAVGDPHGLTFDATGKSLVVTGSGTHELLLFDAAALPWTGGDPGDLIDPDLTKNDGKMRRLPLGGRPLSIVALPDDRAAVANYLLDAVQIIDVKDAKLTKSIALGSPSKLAPERQGEALFYDADRCHNHWFSCHTCHTDGHTCGLNFDTLNDDSYGNPKLTPSLRGVVHTGPWTWHGWQKDLGAGVAKSYTETMFGPKPTDDEIKAVVAFLTTFDQPPNPHLKDGKRTDSAERGRALFEGKANCIHCHKGEHYTSDRNYDVKLEPDGSPYTLWNPPSLLGLWDRGPFLHDGRAKTLDELLEKHHAPEKLGGKELTPEERKDLIEFLLSL
jgi:DNA-binding beta-propeller fold protein YncE